LTDVVIPFNQLVVEFENSLETLRRHDAESNWLNRMRRIHVETIPPGQGVAGTDFSATLNLAAKLTDNCSVDNHAVLDIFIVVFNRRRVGPLQYKQEKDTNQEFVEINTCHAWYFFGPTMSKGKKNDWNFHTACVDRIQEYYKKQEDIQITDFWTDNCGPQYKCKYNMVHIAKQSTKLDSKHSVQHNYAQIYQFKGVWDAAGKVVKDRIKEMEMKRGDGEATRIATAYDCYAKLKEPLKHFKNDWSQLEQERSGKLIFKGNFGIDKRIVGFVTDDPVEFARVQQAHPDDANILFTDRSKPKPNISDVKGTNKLHMVRGKNRDEAGNDDDGWNIDTAIMPCVCLACRRLVTDVPCPFQNIRREDIATIKYIKSISEEERARRSAARTSNDQAIDLLKAQVEEILCLEPDTAFKNDDIKNAIKNMDAPIRASSKADLCRRIIEVYSQELEKQKHKYKKSLELMLSSTRTTSKTSLRKWSNQWMATCSI
jgi:hypothetical protein